MTRSLFHHAADYISYINVFIDTQDMYISNITVLIMLKKPANVVPTKFKSFHCETWNMKVDRVEIFR